MALYYDLSVFKDVYQLILKIFDYTKDFPREYKFTLGQDLKRDDINLVISIYWIRSDGKMEDLFIKRGVPGCYDCDREVIRAFKRLPNIKPAKNQKGEGVDAWLELPPISFTIH